MGRFQEISLRLAGLDGLRGLASLVVLLYHSSFVYIAPQKSSYTGSAWIDLMAFSPLRVPFLGAEAVHLFFVLSGFTLPFLAAKVPSNSIRYLLSRFVRLYPSVWAALTILMLVCLSGPSWGRSLITSVGVSGWIQDALLFPIAGNAIGALWSLTWEVVFSSTLYIWLKVVRRGRFCIQLGTLLLLIYLGDFLNLGLFQYMPMFLVGVTLWANQEAFQKVVEKFLSFLPPTLGLTLIAALITLPYTISPLLGIQSGGFEFLRNILYATEFLSIILIVGLAIWSPSIVSCLQSPISAWLGRISYSLYLLHQILLRWLEALNLSVALTFTLGVILSLAAAGLFYYLFEKRIHRVARWIAKPES